MALPVAQGHNHRQQHYHHRTSASRSRHRKETVPDNKCTPHSHENVQKKCQQKQKETTIPSSLSTKSIVETILFDGYGVAVFLNMNLFHAQ
ncbi:unnamed protein product [Rotaria sordida]|uniref:Uncharacterized protein n=1 Tax=Rotaria sordida TaxID=392033 RepID=A0A815HAN8_9BILA|nr:unnamed protein product [Rotaria sordida]